MPASGCSAPRPTRSTWLYRSLCGGARRRARRSGPVPPGSRRSAHADRTDRRGGGVRPSLAASREQICRPGGPGAVPGRQQRPMHGRAPCRRRTRACARASMPLPRRRPSATRARWSAKRQGRGACGPRETGRTGSNARDPPRGASRTISARISARRRSCNSAARSAPARHRKRGRDGRRSGGNAPRCGS